jgi:hypothetical protein
VGGASPDAPGAARALFQRVSTEVFGEGQESVARELLHHLSTGSTEVMGYIAFDGEVPASAARLHTRAGSAFAGLYGGGTLATHRGRGLYRALIAERARDAERLGAHYLRVDALPTSEPILTLMGFTKLADTWPCVLHA